MMREENDSIHSTDFPETESTTNFGGTSTHAPPPPPPPAPAPEATGNGSSPNRGMPRRDESGSSGSFALPSPSSPYEPIPHSHQRVSGHIGNVIVHFSVGSAKFGPEKVKPLTYFSLDTSVKQAPFPQPTAPTSTQETNPWSINTEATSVDRRYSEYVEMRRFLVYAFPWIVVPPLPPKSHLDGLKTFWADPDSLTHQHKTLDRFMKELMGYPTLLQFHFFQQFCQLPRDTVAFGNFMDNIRKKNSEVDALRGHHSSGVGEATKMVKSLFTSVSSWLSSSPASSPSKGGRHIPADFDERVKVALQRNEPYQQWVSEVKDIARLKEALKPLIGHASEVVRTNHGIYIDVLEAGVGYHDYAKQCSESPRFATFSREVDRTASLLKGIAAQHNGEFGRDETGLVNALMHELFWLDAATESVESMLYVMKNKIEQDILDGKSTSLASRDQAAAALPSTVPPPSAVLDETTRFEQCQALNGYLHKEFLRFWTSHRERMQHLAAAKTRRAIHYLDEEIKMFAKTALVTDMATPTWAMSADPADPTANPDDSQAAWVDAGEEGQRNSRTEQREEALAYFHRLQVLGNRK